MNALALIALITVAVLAAMAALAAVAGTVSEALEHRARKAAAPNGYMAEARQMMAIARADKAAGYHCAAKEAVRAALAFRQAAHAARYYGGRV